MRCAANCDETGHFFALRKYHLNTWCQPGNCGVKTKMNYNLMTLPGLLDDHVAPQEFCEFLDLDHVPDDFATIADVFLFDEHVAQETQNLVEQRLAHEAREARRARTREFMSNLASNELFMLNLTCAFEQYSKRFGKPPLHGAWKYWGIVGRSALKCTFPELKIRV